MAKEKTLVPVETYLESGIQVGTKFKTKFMQKYIHKVNPKNGVAILDLEKVDQKLRAGANFLAKYKPEDILVVCRRENGWKGAKKFAKTIYGDAFPKLITISRLDGRKSHKNILMTIKNLLPKFPKLKYVSIGDGDEKNNLEKLKKELGFTQEVNFIYKSTEQEKLGLLEKSDMFVMPSVVYKKSVEGFGITFIEAASYGKPSIAGIFGGEADAVLEGKTGYLCDGNDLNALYETLLKTLNNDHYKKLGANALEFSKNFSWDKIVKKYIELILFIFYLFHNCVHI